MGSAADLRAIFNNHRDPVLDRPAREAIETDSRDILLSLSTMCALLAKKPVPGPRDRSLALFLDAQVAQLEALVGEICEALRLSDGERPTESFDLSEVLKQAAFRLRAPLNVRVSNGITVCGDRKLAAQIVQSALALAVRSGDGRVMAVAEPASGGGSISIDVPIEDQIPSSVAQEQRLLLLGRMHAEQGGSLTVDRRPDRLSLKLSFAGPRP